MTKKESSFINSYSNDQDLSGQVSDKWNQFMEWKSENSTLYIKEQLEILQRVKNDFIFRNELEFKNFVTGYFADRFRIQYFVDTYIYKTVFRLAVGLYRGMKIANSYRKQFTDDLDIDYIKFIKTILQKVSKINLLNGGKKS